MRPRGWTIRPKAVRDVDATVALLAEVAKEGRYIATEWPFDVDERARAMRDALIERRIVGWVAYDGHRLVGELTVMEQTAQEPHVGMVVTERYRGRGIGAALLDHAIEWARANGRAALRLMVFPENETALALYRKSGFVEMQVQRAAVSRRDGTPRDAILMRRPIAP